MIGTAGAIFGGLGALGSLAGGLIGQGGANAAAGMATNAGNQAFNAAQNAREENTSNFSPYTSTGTSAIGQIGALLGYGSLWNRGGEGATYNYESDPNAFNNANAQLQNFLKIYPGYSPTFQADPGYAFRLSEGTRALDRSAAAKGTLLSGAQGRALTDYGQNAASAEYGNWWNRANTQTTNALDRLYQTAGLGANATASLAGTNAGLTSAGNNALIGAAGTAGNATMSGANALASGIGSGVNNLITAGYLFGNRGGGQSGYTV
jgi:hypothetical protein